MGVGRLIDRSAVENGGAIRPMAKLQAAQIAFIRLASAAVLTDDETRCDSRCQLRGAPLSVRLRVTMLVRAGAFIVAMHATVMGVMIVIESAEMRDTVGVRVIVIVHVSRVAAMVVRHTPRSSGSRSARAIRTHGCVTFGALLAATAIGFGKAPTAAIRTDDVISLGGVGDSESVRPTPWNKH